MSFDRTAFRESLQVRQPLIDEYLKDALRASLDQDSMVGNTWLDAMFAELESFLKDSTHSPQLKLGAVKFAVYLLLLGDAKICKQFERKVYPYVRNLSQYDRYTRLEKRGQELFKNHSTSTTGSQMKQEVRTIGVDLVRICLESVPVWAAWFPHDLSDESKQSQYVTGYEALVKNGMQFPDQQDYQFYTKRNVDRMEEKQIGLQYRVKQITEEVVQELGSQSATTSLVTDQDSHSQLKRPRSSMLRLRGSAIDPRTSEKIAGFEFKSNKNVGMSVQNVGPAGFVSLTNNLAAKNSPVTSQRYSPKEKELANEVQRLKKELDSKMHLLNSQPDLQAPLISRIRQMQQREADLLRTIQSQKQALMVMPNNSTTQSVGRELNELRNQLQRALNDNNSLANECRKLRETVSTLTQENQRLRSQTSLLQRNQNQPEQLASPRSKLSSVVTNQVEELREQLHKLQSQNRQLKVNLLSECIESSEFNQSDLKRRKASRIRFEDYSPEELFEPYYSNLNTEEQIRFRKALLKTKELLVRDPTIEIGCVTQVQGTNRLKLNLFFTNVTRENITEVECSLFCGTAVTLVKGNERPLSIIAPGYQEKIGYVFELTNENFGCAVFTLKYSVAGQLVTKQLLLPISKVKLTEPKAYLQDSQLTSLKERTVELDSRMMQSLSRLPEYFRLMYEKSEAGTTYYHLQFCYLKDKYEMVWSQLGKFVRLTIRFVPDCQEEAERLLDEWAFLLNKQSS